MKAIIPDAKLFFNHLSFISSIAEQGLIKFESNKITIRETDSGCISLCVFDYTETTIDDEASFGAKFKDLVVAVNKNSTLEITIENGTLKMNIGKSEYTHTNIDVSSSELQVIEIEYPIIFEMPYKEFKRILTAIKKVGDSINFKGSKDGLIIFCNNGAKSFKETFEFEEDVALCSYPISPLKGMKDVADTVTISLLTGAPMKLVFGALTLFIAPKAD